jgi:hypothetical protein
MRERELDPGASPAAFFGNEVREARTGEDVTGRAGRGAGVRRDLCVEGRNRDDRPCFDAFVIGLDRVFPQMNDWFVRFWKNSRKWADQYPARFRDWIDAELYARIIRWREPLLIPYQHQWIASNKLANGEHLKTANGTPAAVVDGSVPAVHDGWMRDLTVPGNNDHDFYVLASDPSQPGNSHHTHYVEAGNIPVLVHNSGDCWAEMGGPENWTAVNEGTSGRAAAFQREATGVPNGMGYVVNGIKFDGYQGGTLLDAKGPGYAKFVKNGFPMESREGGGCL